MAFTDETVRLVVSGSLGATGNSDSSFAHTGDVMISGTFDATVLLEAEDLDGVWHGVCSFTQAGFQTFRFANRRPVRIRVAAYTSGTVDFRIEIINTYERVR